MTNLLYTINGGREPFRSFSRHFQENIKLKPCRLPYRETENEIKLGILSGRKKMKLEKKKEKGISK